MNQLEITHFPSLDYACTEAMNTLCTNLSYCGTDVRTILFTSRYEHEGKSSIAMNVMRTLASYGKNVLLVDADLRCSTLARRYRFHFGGQACGLAQYLADLCDLEDAVYRTNLPGAYILPAGREVLNSVQLLASPRFGEMMRQLRENFDVILVDSPPAGVIIDAMEIAKSCDGAVLVVEYNNGRSQDIGEVAANIARTGCPVLGAVMNGVDLKSFGNRKYYYRSERYSSYYRHYGKSNGKPARRTGGGRSERKSEQKSSERKSEPKRSEPKRSESRHSESKRSESKRPEPKEGQKRPFRKLFGSKAFESKAFGSKVVGAKPFGAKSAEPVASEGNAFETGRPDQEQWIHESQDAGASDVRKDIGQSGAEQA